MKTTLLSVITFLCLFVNIAQAQPPQAIRYQAIARDAKGEPMSGTFLKVRAGIHDLLQNGPIVYQETQMATTNTFGLFNLSIGTGNVTMGIFTSINWGLGAKYMEIEIDFGSGFVYMGSSELLSVPYALYSPSVKGDPGVPGIQGVAGVNGNIWHSGTSVPFPGIGTDRDYYLQTGTGDVYLKTGGIWNVVANIKGPIGATGITGATGVMGPIGLTGPAGANGADGVNGATGATGAAGANGSDGATGATGAAGSNGSDGATGATGAAGSNGSDGATGAAGSNGSDGATGATGAAGSNGSDGATGATGAAGSNGSDGATGATGAAGSNGSDGATGATGAAGSNGSDGAGLGEHFSFFLFAHLMFT